jgi:hypothetical protein
LVGKKAKVIINKVSGSVESIVSTDKIIREDEKGFYIGRGETKKYLAIHKGNDGNLRIVTKEVEEIWNWGNR